MESKIKKPCRSNLCLKVGIFENGICPKCTALIQRSAKARKPIKKVSKKRELQLKEYNHLRKEFLKVNNVCPVTGKKATEIHHKKGRIGNLLCDVTNFLAVSREGHIKIELNPEWAKEKGYSLKRTNA